MNKIVMGNHKIGEEQPIFIIAEIGVNHNGNIKIAKKLVDAAKAAKADCVKFQTFVTEEVIAQDAPLAQYQKISSTAKTQRDLVKKLELSAAAFADLKRYVENLDLVFLSTPFDFKSIDLLAKLDVPGFKISSGDLTNKPFIEKIASTGKPIILSTGMAEMHEIHESVEWIKKAGNSPYCLLQCTSSYPTQIHDCNLTTIPALEKEFKVPIGFSDHTTDSIAAIVSVGLGAKIIEKHITLDKKMDGPDHALSMEPHELISFVSNIRKAENAIGDGIKRCLPCEIDVRNVARKSIVAVNPLTKGAVIKKESVGIKRPGTGIEPKHLDGVISKRLKQNIGVDQVISWSDLED